jgi:hypothetical protein
LDGRQFRDVFENSYFLRVMVRLNADYLMRILEEF